MNNRSYISAIAALLLASCATSKLKEASILSKSGAEVTAAAQQPITGMATQVATSETTARLAGILPGTNEPTPDDLKARKNVQTHLKYRAAALKQLEETYTSFAALADYKAGETIGNDVKKLADSINSFAKAVGAKANPVSDAVSSLLQSGTKAIVDHHQHQLLRAASIDIQSRVHSLKSVLISEMPEHAEMLDSITTQKVDNFSFVVANSPLAAKPFINKQLALLGLAADDGTVVAFLPAPQGLPAPDPNDPPKFVPKADVQRIKQLAELYRSELVARSALHMRFYNATVEALTRLEEAHTTFEGTTRLNPYPLISETKTLAKLSEAYQK